MNAKPEVDDKPPKLPINVVLKKKKLIDQVGKRLAIQEENKLLLQQINLINRTKKPTYKTKDMIDDYKRKEKQMVAMAKYPPFWKAPFITRGQERQLSIIGIDTFLTRSVGSRYNMSKNRPRCFLEFTSSDRYLGKIEIELYYDFVPVTVENFMHLCDKTICNHNDLKRKPKMNKKESGANEKVMNYQGCPVHRIVPGYYIQTGDITKGNGSGGCSIYGPVFPDENFHLKHTQAGVLSMTNKGSNTNNSQFMITLKKLQTLDGSQVVFGRVVRGFKTLDNVEDLGTKYGRPRSEVKISKCGLV